MGSNSGDEVESFILSSKYRSAVLETLTELERATPTEIAAEIDIARPHVSRALSELKESGVVGLTVPESRSVGRYYGITEKGEDVWPTIRAELRRVEWIQREPKEVGAGDLVALAQEEFGDSLRTVGVYNGEEYVMVYADPEVMARYSDEEFKQGLRTFIVDHNLNDISVPDEECWSELTNLGSFSLLRVKAAPERVVAISFETNHPLDVSEFAEAVLEWMENET